MAQFELQRLPGAPKEKGTIRNGTLLIDWLDQQSLHNNVIVRVNGKPLDDDFDIEYALKSSDNVTVFDQPEGGVGKALGSLLRPVTKVLSSAMKLLGATPKIGTISSATGDSPNNDLTQQTNRARLYKGRPNIYGQVRAYPDLIQESIYEYIDNKKMVTEWMEIGYGQYDISSVRYSESTLTALDGASYAIFNPGEALGDFAQGYSFDDVDGQELPGTNEDMTEVKQQASTATLLDASYGGGEFYIKINKETGFDSFNDSAKPVPVTVIINVTYGSAVGPVTKDVTIQANLYKSEITNDGTPVNPPEYYGFYFNNLSGTDAQSLPADTTINLTTFQVTEYEGTVVGPFFSALPSTDLWIHLYANEGGGYDGPALISWWQVDDDNDQIAGTEGSLLINLHNDKDTQDYVYGTYKITPTSGLGRYAFTVQRTNNSADDSKLYISGAHAVTYRTGVIYPEDTMVRVTVRQTEVQTSTTDRKYNCLVQRKVISWTAAGGIDYTLRKSRSFADAVLHEWVVVAGQDASRLDIATLYAINDSIADPQLGYFDWTFSDATQSLGERIQTICNVALVNMNWIGDVLTFWRDEKVVIPDAVYSRSNMFWDGYKISYAMSLPGGYDGISVEYTDTSTNTKAYIYLSLSSSGISVVEDETTNANQITLSGSSNKPQALNRAMVEAGKILYSRVSMTVKVLETTQVMRGTVVQCPDMYDNEQQTGYIKGRVGNIFTTSERIAFDGVMYVVMTDSLGNFKGRFRASPVAGQVNAFSADAGAFDLNIYDGKNVQAPSRYFIASESELNSTIWRVDTATPNGDDTQTLALSEYSSEIYP